MNKPEMLSIDEGRKLNEALQLDSLFLYQLKAERVGSGPYDESKLGYNLQIPPVQWTIGDGFVLSLFTVHVNLYENRDGKAQDLARIVVSHNVSYSAQKPLTKEDESLVPHFIGSAGWVHVWPYVRNEVQNLTLRLGLPPLLMPLLGAGALLNVPVTRITPPSDGPTSPSEPQQTP